MCTENCGVLWKEFLWLFIWYCKLCKREFLRRQTYCVKFTIRRANYRSNRHSTFRLAQQITIRCLMKGHTLINLILDSATKSKFYKTFRSNYVRKSVFYIKSISKSDNIRAMIRRIGHYYTNSLSKQLLLWKV